MPGNQVKDWPQYEALRKKGHSKESAARIANSQAHGKTAKTEAERYLNTYDPGYGKKKHK